MSDCDIVDIEYCVSCGAPLENGWCTNIGCIHSGLVYNDIEEDE